MPLLPQVVSFVFGAVIGSFLNVCIHRLPAKLSIVRPASRCPHCGAAIRCWQNVPVFSWLLLRGQCAACKAPISVRYPLVEALTGLLFWQCWQVFGPHPAAGFYAVLCSALVVITFIDLDHQIIPDAISLPGIVVGFLGSFLLPELGWLASLLGILLGGGTLWLVATSYELLTKKEGMGGGDVKLLAMLGAFLGWKAILPIVFFSSLLGTLVGVPLMLLKRADGKLALPFGPFLAAAALLQLFWGREILAWYLSLL
jgi:leader peptidase (prepilin peptidase)/N-methyltransferase